MNAALYSSGMNTDPGHHAPELRRYITNATARSVEFFLDRSPDDERFDMDQPYQRGVVWGLKRRRNLIKSLIIGVPIPAVVLNNRFDAGFTHPGYSQDRNWSWAVVDGKQRITTLRAFVADEFTVPGTWFADAGREDVLYSALPKPRQRKFLHIPLATVVGQFSSLAEEQDLFDLINFSGLAQDETDDDLTAASGGR